MTSRLCKPREFYGFVGGIDRDNIFEEGTVYKIEKIMDQIILTPIGKQPEYNRDNIKIDYQSIDNIILEGDYLRIELNK